MGRQTETSSAVRWVLFQSAEQHAKLPIYWFISVLDLTDGKMDLEKENKVPDTSS